VELAGEVMGLQVGLSFAGFFDLQNALGENAVGAWLTLIVSMLFLSINGHLIMLDALARSFQWFPIAGPAGGLPDVHALVKLGADIFATGLALAMPVVATMLFVNLALGIMARATPQLNIFAIGFPLTLLLGLVAIYFCLPYLEAPLVNALLRGVTGMTP
jgi:flagellar biosynthetic protein FliR